MSALAALARIRALGWIPVGEVDLSVGGISEVAFDSVDLNETYLVVWRNLKADIGTSSSFRLRATYGGVQLTDANTYSFSRIGRQFKATGLGAVIDPSLNDDSFLDLTGLTSSSDDLVGHDVSPDYKGFSGELMFHLPDQGVTVNNGFGFVGQARGYHHDQGNNTNSVVAVSFFGAVMQTTPANQLDGVVLYVDNEDFAGIPNARIGLYVARGALK